MYWSQKILWFENIFFKEKVYLEFLCNLELLAAKGKHSVINKKYMKLECMTVMQFNIAYPILICTHT